MKYRQRVYLFRVSWGCAHMKGGAVSAALDWTADGERFVLGWDFGAAGVPLLLLAVKRGLRTRRSEGIE